MNDTATPNITSDANNIGNVAASEEYLITSDDGEQIAIYESGPRQAPIVLLIHGMMLSHTYWDRVVNVLSKKYRVITYDQRGHGASGGETGINCTIPQLGRDLSAVLHHINPPEKIFIAAHSMGAMAIGQWAMDFPDEPARFARAIFLSNTGFRDIIRHQRIFGCGLPNRSFFRRISKIIAILPPVDNKFSRKILGRILFTSSAPKELVSEALPTAIFSSRSLQKILPSMMEMDVRAGIENLTVPTTIVTADEDNLTDELLGHEIARELRKNGYLRELARLYNCGHLAVMNQPERFLRILLSAIDDAYPTSVGSHDNEKNHLSYSG